MVRSANCTAVTSSTGTLRVNAVTAATVAGQTVCTGATATFTVSTSNTGSGSLTYQWFNNGSSLGSSATAAAYTTANNSSTNDNDTYYCVVRSANCTAVTSSTGTLRVNAVTAATVAGQTVCTGATATFTVSTSNTGSGSLTYQWYNNGSSLGSSATAAAYTTANNSSTNDNDTYYCVVRSANCTAVTSSTGTLRVNAVTAATVAGQTVCTGATATFTVSTSNTGSGSLTYQWYNNGSSLGSSATAAAYTTANNSSTNDNDTYYCVVRSANCTAVTSSTGTLRVNAVTAATVAGQPFVLVLLQHLLFLLLILVPVH